jgi:hypothetical protein
VNGVKERVEQLDAIGMLCMLCECSEAPSDFFDTSIFLKLFAGGTEMREGGRGRETREGDEGRREAGVREGGRWEERVKDGVACHLKGLFRGRQEAKVTRAGAPWPI